MTGPRAYELTPLEVASGLVLGLTPPIHESRLRTPDPIQVLESAILPALRRPPCIVSFSGGRDSSAVLAVATRIARREGLPLPIPSTNRFPEAPQSEETAWQERVVSHLGLDDWVKKEFVDELDSVGPIARGVLRRHGLLWPFNAHFHAPQLEAAAGGSLLTGIGGDEALSPSGWERLRAVGFRDARPEWRDVLRIGFLAAPRPLRRAVLRRRVPLEYAWLTPAGKRAFASEWAAMHASEPFRWTAQLAWRRRLRYLPVGLTSLDVLAVDASVMLVHPFSDPGLTAALAALPRSSRFHDRTEAMRLLFADVLPDDVLSRTTKSTFDQAFWTHRSREFVATWDGTGVDTTMVDPDALRREWASPEPDPRSFTLLQSVWLATNDTKLSVPMASTASPAPDLLFG